MHKTINSTEFRKMILVGAKLLEQNRAKVDALNVFPVPDGDTGTNMGLTIGAVHNMKVEDAISECASKAATAVLLSARGNSGAILALFFEALFALTFFFTLTLNLFVTMGYKAQLFTQSLANSDKLVESGYTMLLAHRIYHIHPLG